MSQLNYDEFSLRAHQNEDSSNIYLLQVVSFDGSTTIQEFLLTLGRSLGVQDCSRSGFALFSDDPRGGEVEACLQNHIKVGFICCLLAFSALAA